MNIVILHNRVKATGARGDEIDTVIQVDAVRSALQRLFHRVRVVEYCSRSICELGSSPREHTVFNLVESIDGNESLAFFAPAELERMGVAHVGNSSAALQITLDKIASKRIMVGVGIPTPEWISGSDMSTFSRGPYILKSPIDHGSVGIDDQSVVFPETPQQLLRLLQERRLTLKDGPFGIDRTLFAERYVEGREYQVALLGGLERPEVLPISEMVYVDFPEGKLKILSFAAKWDSGSFEDLRTVRAFDHGPADAALLEELRAIARHCWDSFRLNGWARVDFRVDERHRPFVLEVNANPCISPDSGFVAAAYQAGFTYDDIIATILKFPVPSAGLAPT